MKIHLPAFLCLGLSIASAQEPIATESKVIDKGPHHRTWENTVTEMLPSGRQAQRTTSFVELASGMHYLKDGAYHESSDEIELFQDGAVARQGAHQIIFSPNFNTAGVIDLLTPDGKRLHSHILGLGVYDTATGRSTLIAEPHDSIGELHPPNEIVYRRAFDGVAADVLYRNTKASFAQDVVILEQIQLPEGFDPETTRLEVWTEFLEAPTVSKDTDTRYGATDENLDFGAMQIGPGSVFSVADNGTITRGSSTVKRWLTTEGRTFLVEAVPFQLVAEELQALPPPNQQAANAKSKRWQVAKVTPDQRPFPAALQARTKQPGQKIQTANLPRAKRGLVLDYDLTANMTNWTFRADYTYYVSGPVNLYGTNNVEGGVVFKMAPTNNAQIIVNGQLKMNTAPYRPVTITARDDHSIGTQIGSASISGYYGSYGIYLNTTPDTSWEYLRIFYASNAIGYKELNHTLRHLQIAHCRRALENQKTVTTTLENALIYDVSSGFFNNSGSLAFFLKAAHLTLHQCANFGETTSSSNVTAFLTNSMLVRVTNWGTTTWTTNLVHIGTDSSVFQNAGASLHYLASGSPYRNIGVTGISSTLSNALIQQTTYPPIIIPTGASSSSLVLIPQAQRDTDAFDLGAHYLPIDYAFGHVFFTDATITLKPGTVIATYGTASDDYGINLLSNTGFTTEGTPTAPTRVVRHNTVQELATNTWSYRVTDSIFTAYPLLAIKPTIRLRFNFCSSPAQDTCHLRGYDGTNFQVELTDCQFFGGLVRTDGPTFNITNCLFARTGVTINESIWAMGPVIQNNTFSRGSLDLLQDPDSGVSSTWTLKNNVFDDIVLTNTVLSTLTQSNNAYTTNVTKLIPTNSTDLVLSVTNLTYDSWLLGKYYVPTNIVSQTNLFNSGSTTANLLGLFHYTSTTNQLKETNSVVDRGFHYVALNSSGQAIDTDSDSVADYYENFTGNGLANSRETSWTNSTDFGLKVVITRPKDGSTIP